VAESQFAYLPTGPLRWARSFNIKNKPTFRSLRGSSGSPLPSAPHTAFFDMTVELKVKAGCFSTWKKSAAQSAGSSGELSVGYHQHPGASTRCARGFLPRREASGLNLQLDGHIKERRWGAEGHSGDPDDPRSDPKRGFLMLKDRAQRKGPVANTRIGLYCHDADQPERIWPHLERSPGSRRLLVGDAVTITLDRSVY